MLEMPLFSLEIRSVACAHHGCQAPLSRHKRKTGRCKVERCGDSFFVQCHSTASRIGHVAVQLGRLANLLSSFIECGRKTFSTNH
eukprot:scaffold1475_cov167-Amphora_coffeaeformis.AAC.5